MREHGQSPVRKHWAEEQKRSANRIPKDNTAGESLAKPSQLFKPQRLAVVKLMDGLADGLVAEK